MRRKSFVRKTTLKKITYALNALNLAKNVRTKPSVIDARMAFRYFKIKLDHFVRICAEMEKGSLLLVMMAIFKMVMDALISVH